MTPQLIGYWHSPVVNEPFDKPWVHPRHLVDSSWDAGQREAIVEYLRKGRQYNGYLGGSWCRFGCDRRDMDMGASELTDGTFYWPTGLVHYVEEHAVRLPQKFVDHAMGVKRFVDAQYGDHDSFWVDFCSKYPADPVRKRQKSPPRRSFLDEFVDNFMKRHK